MGVVLWFVTAVAAGAATAWWLHEDPAQSSGAVTRNPDVPLDSAHVLDAPALGGRPAPAAARPTEAPAMPIPGDRAPSPVAASSATPTGLVAGWIRIKMRHEDPGNEDWASAFALPAGEPGTDDTSLIPHVDVGPQEEARLPVPRAGRYDVALSNLPDFLRINDVLVEEGKETPVEFLVPQGGDVTVRCPGWPPNQDVRGQMYFTLVSSGPSAWVPGRHQSRRESFAYPLQADNTYEGKFERGKSYDVAFSFEEREPIDRSGRRDLDEGSWSQARRYEAIATPARARAGDVIGVNVARLTRLRLLVTPDSESWTEGFSVPVRFSLSQGNRVRTTPWAFTTPIPGRTEVVVWGEAGSARLTWEGEHVVPEEIPNVELDARGESEVHVTLRRRPGAFAGMTPIPLVFQPDPGRGDEVVFAAGLPVAPSYWDEMPSQRWDNEEPPPSLPAPWRAYREVVIAVGERLASEPLSVPSAGPLEVPLKPAGMLVLVPEMQVPEELGELRIRRKDGHVTPCTDEGTGELVMSPWRGRVIGPLPAGTYEFEVLVGRTKVKDVRVEVKAGHTLPLVIPE